MKLLMKLLSRHTYAPLPPFQRSEWKSPVMHSRCGVPGYSRSVACCGLSDLLPKVLIYPTHQGCGFGGEISDSDSDLSKISDISKISSSNSL